MIGTPDQFFAKYRERNRYEKQLAAEVRSAERRLARARAKRDDYIRAASKENHASKTRLAHAFGISRQALYKILNGRK